MPVSDRVVLDEIFSIAPSLKVGREQRDALLIDEIVFGLDNAPHLRIVDGATFEFVEGDGLTDSSEALTAQDVSHVFKARFDHDLTPSEVRLLMQLIAGATLPDLSKQDGVAYGTRRNQLAAIRQKAGRSRQTDVIVVMAVLCANYLKKFDPRPDGAGREILDLYAKYYKQDFRLHRPTMSSGRELVVVDVGPVGGRKVLFMHPGVFPFAPAPHETEFLRQKNIRVLSPVRPGYYGVALMRGETALVLDQFSTDVVEFLSVIGAENAPIASHMAGVASAIAVARMCNLTCPKLIVASPRFHPTRVPHSPWGFARAWHTLQVKNRNRIRPVIITLARSFTNSERIVRGLMRVFHGSKHDLDMLEFGNRQTWFHDSLRSIISRNMEGMFFDLDTAGLNLHKQLGQITAKKTIWYAKDDPLANLEEHEQKLRVAGCEIVLFPDCSRYQFIFNSEALLLASLAE